MKNCTLTFSAVFMAIYLLLITPITYGEGIPNKDELAETSTMEAIEKQEEGLDADTELEIEPRSLYKMNLSSKVNLIVNEISDINPVSKFIGSTTLHLYEHQIADKIPPTEVIVIDSMDLEKTVVEDNNKLQDLSNTSATINSVQARNHQLKPSHTIDHVPQPKSGSTPSISSMEDIDSAQNSGDYIEEIDLDEDVEMIQVQNITVMDDFDTKNHLQNLVVTVTTSNAKDATPITVELVTQYGSSFNPAIMVSGKINKNTSRLFLTIPNTLPSGSYRLKITSAEFVNDSTLYEIYSPSSNKNFSSKIIKLIKLVIGLGILSFIIFSYAIYKKQQAYAMVKPIEEAPK